MVKTAKIIFTDATSQADVDFTVEAIELWLANNNLTAAIEVSEEEEESEASDAAFGE